MAEIRNKIAPYRNRIAAGFFTTFGVNEEGKVLAVGKNEKGQCNVSGWSDIVAVSSSYCHTFGLKSNGSVLVVGVEVKGVEIKSRYEKNYYTCGELNVFGWENIVDVFSEDTHTVGLKSDGTVVATKYTGVNNYGQCDVADWKDIVAITAQEHTTIGLKSNGEVEVAGAFSPSTQEILYWNDIVAVSSGRRYTVGLKSDGTVVATGIYRKGGRYAWKKRNYLVADWRDIVAVAAGSGYIVGLKSDGTVITTGYTDDRESYYGQCDVSNWKDIVAIAAGEYHTIGLKSDGTLVAVGKNENGECNVTGWKLFKSDAEKEADYTSACHWQESGVTGALKRAVEVFKSLKDYRDSSERAKECTIHLINAEKSSLQAELSNLKGLFIGKRRKEIEARLAQIDNELKKLQ